MSAPIHNLPATTRESKTAIPALLASRIRQELRGECSSWLNAALLEMLTSPSRQRISDSQDLYLLLLSRQHPFIKPPTRLTEWVKTAIDLPENSNFEVFLNEALRLKRLYEAVALSQGIPLNRKNEAVQ